MELRNLGCTGIKVSRLCFGTLTMGPLQADLPPKEGARLIRHALERGVNFIDTAQSYGTYPHICTAIQGLARTDVVITTKSYAYDRQGAQAALDQALHELNTDYIDIFLLHEQESGLTLEGHREALEYLWQAKREGKIRAVGLSTHHVAAARSAITHPMIQVVHPLYNMTGIGICDGSSSEMGAAIHELALVGKGVYGMKALGGGHLIPRWREAMAFVLGNEDLSAVALGMQSLEEVEVNLATICGHEPPEPAVRRLGTRKRYLHIEAWCQGCGRCVEICPSDALHLDAGRVHVDHERCVTCGYCAGRCPDFCLKVL